jgi:membrane protein implicated in regulation of membrane protease activity
MAWLIAFALALPVFVLFFIGGDALVSYASSNPEAGGWIWLALLPFGFVAVMLLAFLQKASEADEARAHGYSEAEIYEMKGLD